MSIISKGKLAHFPWENGLLFSLLTLFVSFSFSTALVEIATVAGLLFFSGLILTRKKNPFSFLPHFSFAALLVYVSIVSLSLFWTEYPKESFRGLFKVLQQISIFILAAQLPRTVTASPLFENVFLILFAATVANGLFQYAFGADLIRGYQYVEASAGPRITSSFKSYGLFAAFLVLVTPLAMAYALAAPRFSRLQILLVVLVLEGLICLYLTRSRGAWLGFFIGSFLTLLAFRQWRFAGVLTVAAIVGILMLPRNVLIHLDIERKEQSIVERFDLWQRAVDVIEVKPFTGTGINTYTKAHVKYDKSESWRVRDYYAHNGYLQMAAEIGIPGTAAFILFLFSFLITAYKRSHALLVLRERLIRGGLLAGTAGFCIFAVWDTLLHNPQSVLAFWFIAGILASAVKKTEAEIAS